MLLHKVEKQSKVKTFGSVKYAVVENRCLMHFAIEKMILVFIHVLRHICFLGLDISIVIFVPLLMY